MKVENPRGTRDYLPEEKILRDSVMNTIVNTFERYGFNPLETPIMEKWDVLSAKYTAGESSDVLKETYRLTDQGKRELGLRYDFTVPLSRFMGMNPTLKMPFKRYQVGPVFRDGPIKKGRTRQFYQCDADIVGSSSMKADAECIKLALDVFDQLGIKIIIKVNNRKLLNSFVKKAGIKNAEEAIISLDKLEKYGRTDVLNEMREKGIYTEKAEALIEMAESSIETLKTQFKDEEGMKELEELFSYVDDKRVVFTPSLARGLAYYTGTVLEAYCEDLDVSLAGGGRFDNMVGKMMGKDEMPAVGLSFGMEPICELLKDKVEPESISKVLVIGIKVDVSETVDQLRKSGVNTDQDVIGRSISKNLDYANSYKIPYVIIIGEKEQKENKVTLRNMKTGKEELIKVEEAIKKLK